MAPRGLKIRPRPELSATKKEKPLRYNWVTPFILSPHSRDVLYYGTNRLYRSFDRGTTWTAISEDLTSNREQGDVLWVPGGERGAADDPAPRRRRTKKADS